MENNEDINDILQRIDATYDTIIGLENSIKEMENELRIKRRQYAS